MPFCESETSENQNIFRQNIFRRFFSFFFRFSSQLISSKTIFQLVFNMIVEYAYVLVFV